MRCLSIHLTDLCNSKCSFCVVGSPLYRADTIDYTRIVSFLRENAASGYDVVNLHGGEATIHPLFRDTLKLIRELGYPEVHLQTNGISLADVQFAMDTVDLGVSLFIVSLHGDSPETHDTQTGSVGGFARTIRGIKNVKALGARVRTNTVVTKQNLGVIIGTVKAACRLGVDHINISNLHPVGSALLARERVMPSLTETVQCIEPAVAFAEEYGAKITLEGFPYCVVGRLHPFQLNNEYRDIRMLIRGAVLDDYDAFMNEECRTYVPPCDACVMKHQCGGVYPEYVQLRGWDEFHPIHSIPDGSPSAATPGE